MASYSKFLKFIRLLLLMILMSGTVRSQKHSKDWRGYEELLDSTASIFLQPDNSDSVKKLAFHQLDSTLEDVLHVNGSFQYPFDSTKRISILTSSDNLVRFYTYHYKSSDGRFHQSGFVQYEYEKTIYIKKLSAHSGLENSLTANQHDTWRGAIYYKIIDLKFKKNQPIYTLLGWNGFDDLSTKKIIDVFHISMDGEPMFGKPIFEYPQSVSKEFVEFEYSAEVQMTLVYEENNQTIVFDHLSPQTPSLKGISAYYGPDLSYDAFVWEKGKWVYQADYDARLDRNLKDRFYEMKLRDQQPIFQKP